ncbi:class I SAM-dependent methyltransferase [Amycolatopsis rhizosphaerae]|uniref:Class I SAM-dependent methyltransferase n=1 Tax=Amycolatopsis rhizosphaerae TaxID=2053003 RepID=A0A558CT91_9PSEU|nr:class I SAM-dependent methyltransferase [Amycolatopsis rhizosphaerae]TVT51984.1 class I SAM-dependent methyltransferase [Amycolatopsis rhizosphaerae]
MLKALNELVQRHRLANGESYDRHEGRVFEPVYWRVADDVAAAAPEGAVVLDAGCGSGKLAVEIATRRSDLRVHGIDLEPGMIEVARRRAVREGLSERVEFSVADLADLPLPDGSADIVVSTASLHHWTDVDGAIASLTRVARAEARLWIYDIRWVPGGRVRSSAARQHRRVTRTLVPVGRFPLALFQRFELAAA